MLIKLIETIQKDKQKKIDELEALLRQYKSVVTTKKCNEKGCKALSIEGEYISKILVGPELYKCQGCYEYVCEDHLYAGINTIYCSKC